MSPAFHARLPLVIAFTLLANGLVACRSATEETDPINSETPTATGGRRATGGRAGAMGAAPKGGAPGAAPAPAGSGGASGAPTAPAPAADGAVVSDAPGSPEVGPADAPAVEVSAPASDASVPGAGPLGPNGIAICHADPLAISICKQLETACENCPPGGPPPSLGGKNQLAEVCFALVNKAKAGKAKDAECAKFALDNKCPVDKGGNVCGTLNCAVTGCDKAACDKAQEGGDTAKCRTFMAKCPCK